MRSHHCKRCGRVNRNACKGGARLAGNWAAFRTHCCKCIAKMGLSFLCPFSPKPKTDSMSDQKTTNAKPYARAWIAPTVLCVVAIFCLIRVVAMDQSPWKGGGFGMFSTLDKPQSRFVRVYLISGQDEIPVEIPESINKFVKKMQAAPSQSQLESIGSRLATLSWKDDLCWWQKVSDQWNRDNEDSTAGRFSEQDLQKLTASSATASLPRGSKRVLKSVGSSNPPQTGDEFVSYDSVRIELWRVNFDTQTNTVSSRLAMDSTHRRMIPARTGDVQ